MLPTTTHTISDSNQLRHPWPHNEKRGWAAYDDDNPWRKGESDGWLASLLGRRWRDDVSWRDLVGRLIGIPADQLNARSARSAPSLFSLPSIATLRFVLLCGLWYMSSALSSNTGKAIMTQFRYPVTLTIVQFGFVASYCLVFASPALPFTRIRTPTRAIIRSTLPMAMFQVGGHIFSSMAISRIPVSTVHTIKALSPLFTVAAYAAFFGVSYSPGTYLSLLPLTAGVMLACSFDVSASNFLGLLCAFGSALVFVSSNIFFKKIMPSPNAGHGPSGVAHKLDKLNLLFYSSGLAFLIMVPIWAYSDLGSLMTRWSTGAVAHPSTSHSHGVTYYFLVNGSVHWAQNIIAFAILSSTSPVTYSIASLIKRIAVIIIAIAWFRQAVHPVQGFGIGLTFVGLWMYNSAKSDVERGENKMRRVEAARDLMLPSVKTDVAPEPGPEAVSSSLFRSRAPSVPFTTALSPQAAHMKQMPTSPLHVQTIPSKLTPPRVAVTSPIESYPSPPPSIDSPPPEALTLHSAGTLFSRRVHDQMPERSATPMTSTQDPSILTPRPIAVAAQ